MALGRFISANFMHVAMTGLCGLALTRWLRFHRSCWEHSLLTIIGVILIHGAYDFCLSMRDPRGLFSLGFFATVMLMGLTYGYIQELRRVRLARGNIFGPLWVFLVGVGVLVGCSLVATSRLYGLEMAAVMMVGEGLSSALLIGLFSIQLKDL
jgi:hypothetical protein